MKKDLFLEIDSISYYKIIDVFRLKIGDLLQNIYDLSNWRIENITEIDKDLYRLFLTQNDGIRTIEKFITFTRKSFDKITDNYLFVKINYK